MSRIGERFFISYGNNSHDIHQTDGIIFAVTKGILQTSPAQAISTSSLLSLPIPSHTSQVIQLLHHILAHKLPDLGRGIRRHKYLLTFFYPIPKQGLVVLFNPNSLLNPYSFTHQPEYATSTSYPRAPVPDPGRAEGGTDRSLNSSSPYPKQHLVTLFYEDLIPPITP